VDLPLAARRHESVILSVVFREEGERYGREGGLEQAQLAAAGDGFRAPLDLELLEDPAVMALDPWRRYPLMPGSARPGARNGQEAERSRRLPGAGSCGSPAWERNTEDRSTGRPRMPERSVSPRSSSFPCQKPNRLPLYRWVTRICEAARGFPLQGRCHQARAPGDLVVPLKNRALRSPTEHTRDDVTAILRRLFSYSLSFRPLLETSSISFLRLTGRLYLWLDVYAFGDCLY
jgi:hypothetical protein